jgi:hypothetical protein
MAMTRFWSGSAAEYDASPRKDFATWSLRRLIWTSFAFSAAVNSRASAGLGAARALATRTVAATASARSIGTQGASWLRH